MLDIDDIILVALDFVASGNGAVLVDDDVADGALFLQDTVAKDDGTVDFGAFLDLDATADDGIFDGSFDNTTIGDEAIGDFAFGAIDGWRGVMGAGEDRPIVFE